MFNKKFKLLGIGEVLLEQAIYIIEMAFSMATTFASKSSSIKLHMNKL